MDSLMKKRIKKYFKRHPLTPSLQLAFLKRLYRLLDRGYPLHEALQIISWDEKLKETAQNIYDTLYDGKYLDEALKKASFHPLIVMYLYFVRINGDLLTSLTKSIDMFEQRILALQKFKRVSRYPLFLVSLFIALLLLIRQFILPSYVEMFQVHANSLRTVELTLWLFNLFFTLLCSLIVIIFITTMIWYFQKYKLSIDERLNIYRYIPVCREYIRMQTSFYFATHVSLLLKAGLSIKQIVEHLKNQTELPILQYYADIMHQHLSKGYYLDELLSTLPFLDSRLASIFRKYHNKDELEKDLVSYADFLSEMIERRTKMLITYIQPVTFVLLGIFIISIYFSLLWPMFQLIDSI